MPDVVGDVFHRGAVEARLGERRCRPAQDRLLALLAGEQLAA